MSETPDGGPHDFDLRRWIDEVRDPATRVSEGVRTIRTRDAEAEYEIVPLPDGRWAVRLWVAYTKGNLAGRGIPWQALATRPECVRFFLETARYHFRGGGDGGSREKASQVMTRLLGAGNDFIEPPAMPREEPGTNHLERIRQARRKELMAKFPLFAIEIEQDH